MDPRGSWDRGHTKILQDHGHVPHQGCQLAGLDDTVRLGVLKKPVKLNDLHQLITIIPGIEPSRSHSVLSSSSFPSPNILLRSRTCFQRSVWTCILSRYSCRVALTLAHSTSRAALTWVRAFLEILTFSTLVARAFSVRVSSSSHARSSSCISSTVTTAGTAVLGLGGG
jgi:hypothetical protein